MKSIFYIYHLIIHHHCFRNLQEHLRRRKPWQKKIWSLQELVEEEPLLKSHTISMIFKMLCDLKDIKKKLHEGILYPSDPLSQVVDDLDVALRRKKNP